MFLYMLDLYWIKSRLPISLVNYFSSPDSTPAFRVNVPQLKYSHVDKKATWINHLPKMKFSIYHYSYTSLDLVSNNLCIMDFIHHQDCFVLTAFDFIKMIMSYYRYINHKLRKTMTILFNHFNMLVCISLSRTICSH